MVLCCGEVDTDLFRWEGLHLLLFFGRELASSGGVVGDQPLLHRLVEALAEHGVKAADSFVAQAQILHVLVPFDPALGLGFVVELLEIQRGELTEFNFADVGRDVVFNVAAVVFRCAVFDGGLAVVLVPEPAPFLHCVLT